MRKNQRNDTQCTNHWRTKKKAKKNVTIDRPVTWIWLQVRPPLGADASECLRVLRPPSSNHAGGTSKSTGSAHSSTADYLIPLANQQLSDGVGTGSVADLNRPERCGYWETSFTREGVKAIARGESFAENSQSSQSGSTGNLSLGGRSVKRRSIKGYAAVPPFEAPPAGALGLSQSQSTQPLLGNGTPPDSPGIDSGPSISAAERNDGNAAQTLDASMLCRQSYANIRIANPSTTPPRSTPSKTNSRPMKQNEISC